MTDYLYLDGTGQHVSVPDNAIYPSGDSPYTVEAVFKAKSLERAVLAWGYPDRLRFNVLYLRPNKMVENWWWLGEGNDLGAIYAGSDGISGIADGVWHHVSSTYDGTTHRLYIDGALVASRQESGLNVPGSNITIGRIKNPGNPGVWDNVSFHGWLKEVRFFNIARSSAQIADGFLNAISASAPGLVAWYRFSNISGTVVPNLAQTGPSLNGTIVGGATVQPDSVSTPEFSIPPGTYPSARTVSISTATPGATIRYTLDGTTPTTASPIYTGAIAVATSKTIKAAAFKTGLTQSQVLSGDFVINQADSVFKIRNWDVVRGTLELQIDEKNNFNRGQAVFDFRPNRNENAKLSPVFRNQASITQQGKAVAKKVVFPNLYVESDVSNQFKEMLRLSSASFEIISCKLTWRSMLLEIGQFVRLTVKIGSTIFEDVPCMIREIGYDPEGFKIAVKMWSFQMAPFGSYQPGYHGTVGGSQAVITQE